MLRERCYGNGVAVIGYLIAFGIGNNHISASASFKTLSNIGKGDHKLTVGISGANLALNNLEIG